jgi:hypothetical protein
MTTTELIIGTQRLSVSRRNLMIRKLFQDDPILLTIPDGVRCRPSPEAFQLFVEAVEGRHIKWTNSTACGVLKLGSEFQLAEVTEQVSHFLCPFHSRVVRFSEAIDRITVLEKRVAHSHNILLSAERQHNRVKAFETTLEMMKLDFSNYLEKVEAFSGSLFESVESAIARHESTCGGELRAFTSALIHFRQVL